MSTEATHIIFTGRVQGVGFRFTAYNMAAKYGLTGYVRNLPDSSVEMLAQGRPDDINNAIEELKSRFIVSKTDISHTEVNTEYNDFKIAF